MRRGLRLLPRAESSLRHQEAPATCAFGGHAIFWAAEAVNESQALGLLPYFVAERATAIKVEGVRINEDLGPDLRARAAADGHARHRATPRTRKGLPMIDITVETQIARPVHVVLALGAGRSQVQILSPRYEGAVNHIVLICGLGGSNSGEGPPSGPPRIRGVLLLLSTPTPQHQRHGADGDAYRYEAAPL